MTHEIMIRVEDTEKPSYDNGAYLKLTACDEYDYIKLKIDDRFKIKINKDELQRALNKINY